MSGNDESKANPKVNIEALGDAPATALGNLYQTVAHSIGIAMQNATQAQQQAVMQAQAATSQGISTIYSVDTAAVAEAMKKVDKTDAMRTSEELQKHFDDGKP